MDKYVCDVCGYVYDPAVGDPDNGIDPGTSFDQLPEDWVCPLCGVGGEASRGYGMRLVCMPHRFRRLHAG